MSIKEPALADLGNRLQAIRKRLGFMQKDFARQLGISGASLSEIEAGNAKPRFEIYFNLTGTFNVSIQYLLYGRGSMFVSGEPDLVGGSVGVKRFDEYRRFLESFLKYFRESLLVRYTMMSHFTAFLLEKESLIEKNIKKVRLLPGVDSWS